ncbi:MAG: hypothetical protein VB853_04165 [Pirellulales bacterium]
MSAHQWKINFLTLLTALSSPWFASAAEPVLLDEQQFRKLHVMMKPQRGESRWMEIDWYPSVWQARQKAAAEGKPILLMAGSGGAPAAGC